MSTAKYANLPDIDTSQDIYETEDSFPTRTAGDSSDDETGVPSRPSASGSRPGKNGETTDGLDSSHLVADEASKKFRKAERQHERQLRSLFVYPSSRPPSPTSPTHPRTLTERLEKLQRDISELELELSDPTNPLLSEEAGDPGTLMRSLVDVRARLEKAKRSSRGKLVESALNRHDEKDAKDAISGVAVNRDAKDEEGREKKEKSALSIEELDRRLGELEDLVGSSTVALDESAPFPTPLLTMLTKINNQLGVLSAPRYLDNISRRLKLLISDLDRLAAAQNAHGSKRQAPPGAASATHASPLQEQLLPLLTRLTPHLPQIPHMLTRMRTLSSLHAAAADFQGTLGALEDEQRRVRSRLEVLTKAVESVEKSLDENANVVRANVSGLEERIDHLTRRLDALGAS